MFDLKKIIITSICGFILSFLFGLFSGATILVILLRALCFAIVFALLALLIQIVTSKFFEEDDRKLSDTEPTSQEAVKPQTGTNVDITIEDEDLPEDSGGPEFILKSDFNVINNSDKKIEKKPPELDTIEQAPKAVVSNTEKEDSSNDSFKPMSFNELPRNVAPTNPFAKEDNEVTSAPQSSEEDIQSSESKNDTNEMDELDELPDIGDLVSEKTKNDSNDQFIKNSDFALNGNKVDSTGEITSKPNEGRDSVLMAEAIRTILTKEE